MLKNKIVIFVVLVLALFSKSLFLKVDTASASEGTIELTSTGNEPYRCYAASIRMLEPEYRILFTCKFILYPAEEDVFNYIVWASPVEGTKAVKLGYIGQGRGEFKTKVAFTNLFVTTEITKDVKTPTGRVVMRGAVTPIQFLEEVKAYEPTPTTEVSQETSNISPTGTSDSAPALSTREKLFTAFKRAGIAALVAIVALVGLIFVITRSRG